MFAVPWTLVGCPAWAAEWNVIPSLSLGETYTDNVALETDASKRADWVTQVIPGISVAASGARLRFDAKYAYEANYYARAHEDKQTYDRLNASGKAELAEQLLFVDAGASINQYTISLQNPITLNSVNATGNVATVSSFFVSPHLRRDFGSDLQAEARMTYSASNSDSSSIDAVAEGIDLRLKSGPAYRLLRWSLDYAWQDIDYETQDDISIRKIRVNARRPVSRSVGLLALGGYEYYESGTLVPESKGLAWGVGADWVPTPRTRLAATVGERLYDDAYAFDFQHRTRLTAWSLSYKEEITTTHSEFFAPATTSTAGYLDTLFVPRFPDQEDRQREVEEFTARTGLPPSLGAPVNFSSNDLFIMKRWQASAGLLGARHVLIASVFDETREMLFGGSLAPSMGDFAVSDNIRQTGTSLHWNWRMTARSAWNLGGTYSREEFPDINRVDHLIYLGLGVTRQFQPRVSGSLGFRRQQNDSNQSAFGYTENAVFATLGMSL